MSEYAVLMPRLGESVNEGEILKWLVTEGDYVAEFDPIVEVTTDKVDSEVPAPASGTLKEILAEAGDIVSVGDAIAIIEIVAAA
jgi:pyruvate/2-oxoglutarate dehydrogenase complex dihydrolipoamide acyltransferase (E2) component